MDKSRALNDVKIIAWNCQTILNKREELKAYLETNKPNRMLLRKTFLKPYIGFSIPNYTVDRNNRKHKKRGGVAILIKKDVKHYSL